MKTRFAHGSCSSRWSGALAIGLIVLFAGEPALAQDTERASPTLSLAEARERAWLASPTLQAAREALAAAVGEERQAGAFLNPSLAYSREQTSRRGETNSQDIVLLEQPFEIAGQRTLRQEIARLRREAADERLETAQAELDFEVARAFALALAADARAAYATDAAQAFARAREVSARRRERGDVSGYEDRRLALEAARYAALRADALREQRAVRLALAALMAPTGEATSALTSPLVDPPELPPLDPDLASLRELTLRRRPDLLAAEREAEAAWAAARLAGRERVPTPLVGAGYQREQMAGTAGSWDGYAAQLSVPIPLFDRRGGAVEAAEAAAGRSRAELRELRRSAVLEIERTSAEAQAAEEQIEAIRPQLGPEAEAALRAARVAYAEGEISLVEWLDAVRAYYEAQSTFAALRADYFIRRAALERSVGSSLFRGRP